ncbi:MAG: hypothetical protein HQL22_06395 [Candidatus Omnitrophica bacterium]|nr:hypothetical protein [Candidatus Omnitrophota bacterium]
MGSILRRYSYRKIIAALVAVCFLLSTIASPAWSQTASLVPAAEIQYAPLLLRGLMIVPQTPFKIDFIIDQGSKPLSDSALRTESLAQVRYFLAALTMPKNDLWVNLSPYESDRIVPETLGNTALGRDLLDQDYVLKQLSAAMLHPDEVLGKQFWARVYHDLFKKFGTTDIPIEMLNKVWIVPGDAEVYEDGGKVLVAGNSLKVELDVDYQARQAAGVANDSEDVAITRAALREVIVPAIEKEVNEGAHFMQLRQIYQAVILAHWYKEKAARSILQVKYIDHRKLGGIDINDKKASQAIFEKYVAAFKKGVYGIVREEEDIYTNELIPRKYFSGGCSFAQMAVHIGSTPSMLTRAKSWMSKKFNVFVLAVGLLPCVGACGVLAQTAPEGVEASSSVPAAIAATAGFSRLEIAPLLAEISVKKDTTKIVHLKEILLNTSLTEDDLYAVIGFISKNKKLLNDASLDLKGFTIEFYFNVIKNSGIRAAYKNGIRDYLIDNYPQEYQQELERQLALHPEPVVKAAPQEEVHVPVSSGLQAGFVSAYLALMLMILHPRYGVFGSGAEMEPGPAGEARRQPALDQPEVKEAPAAPEQVVASGSAISSVRSLLTALANDVKAKKPGADVLLEGLVRDQLGKIFGEPLIQEKLEAVKNPITKEIILKLYNQTEAGSVSAEDIWYLKNYLIRRFNALETNEKLNKKYPGRKAAKKTDKKQGLEIPQPVLAEARQVDTALAGLISKAETPPEAVDVQRAQDFKTALNRLREFFARHYQYAGTPVMVMPVIRATSGEVLKNLFEGAFRTRWVPSREGAGPLDDGPVMFSASLDENNRRIVIHSRELGEDINIPLSSLSASRLSQFKKADDKIRLERQDRVADMNYIKGFSDTKTRLLAEMAAVELSALDPKQDPVGGIDLNDHLIHLKTSGSGASVPFAFDSVPLNDENFDGLIPQVLSVQPFDSAQFPALQVAE